jgi:hypothetical protein
MQFLRSHVMTHCRYTLHTCLRLFVCSPVNLGGVLAREGATSVGAPSSVGVNNDLATGQTSISLRFTVRRQALKKTAIVCCSALEHGICVCNMAQRENINRIWCGPLRVMLTKISVLCHVLARKTCSHLIYVFTETDTCTHLGSADNEAARGVQVHHGLVVHHLGGDHGLDNVLDELRADLLVGEGLALGLAINGLGVLGGDEEGGHALGDGLSVDLLVLDGHLCVCVCVPLSIFVYTT